MTGARRTIEVDEATAVALENRAAAAGLTVSAFLDEILSGTRLPELPDPSDIAELDRLWEAASRPGGTADHAEVVRWLETWGTPGFRPWDHR